MIRTIEELRNIADTNAQKTALGSITPTDVFGLQRDVIDTLVNMTGNNVMIIDPAFTNIVIDTLPDVTRELVVSTFEEYEEGKLLATNFASITGVKVFTNVGGVITFQYTFIVTETTLEGKDNIIQYHVSVSSTDTVTTATAERYTYVPVEE